MIQQPKRLWSTEEERKALLAPPPAGPKKILITVSAETHTNLSAFRKARGIQSLALAVSNLLDETLNPVNTSENASAS